MHILKWRRVMNKHRRNEVFRVLEHAKSRNLLPKAAQEQWQRYLEQPSNSGELVLNQEKLEKLAVAKNFVDMERYEEAFHIFKWLGDITSGEISGDCFKQAAKCAQKTQKYAEAKEMLQQAGIAYGQAGIEGAAAECWEAVGDHLAQENLDTGDMEHLADAKYYKRAAKCYMRSGDDGAAMRAYKKVAESYIRAGEIGEGAKYLILAGEVETFLKIVL